MEIDFELRKGAKGTTLTMDEQDDFVKETLSPKQQMEKMMHEVVHDYTERFHSSLKDMKIEIIDDLHKMQHTTETKLLLRYQML